MTNNFKLNVSTYVLKVIFYSYASSILASNRFTFYVKNVGEYRKCKNKILIDSFKLNEKLKLLRIFNHSLNFFSR